MADRSGLHYCVAIFFLLEGAVAGLPQPVRNHIHGAFEFDLFPFFGIGRAIFNFFQSPRMGMQLISGRTFRAQSSTRNRRFRIALNRDQLSILVIDHLPAADPAIRTDRWRRSRAIVPRSQVFGALGETLGAGAVGASSDLLD